MCDEWIISRAEKLTKYREDSEQFKTGKMLINAIDAGRVINKIVIGVDDKKAVIINLGNKVESK